MTNAFPAFPLDHLPLRGAADNPALRIKDRVYSYQTLNIRVGRLAKFLASRVCCGRPRGDVAAEN